MFDRNSSFQDGSSHDADRPRRMVTRDAYRTQSAAARPPRPAPSVLSRDQIMHSLGSLVGLVAIDAVKPQQATAMRNIYQSMLNEHARASSSSATTGGISDAILAALQQNPEMLNLLEPLLTDAQFQTVTQTMFESDEDPATTPDPQTEAHGDEPDGADSHSDDPHSADPHSADGADV